MICHCINFPEIYAMTDHVYQSHERKGGLCGKYSEQASEAVHYDFSYL